MESACLSVEQVASYVGDSLAETARIAIDGHLDSCESCRSTVAAAVRAARVRDVGAEDELAAGTRVGRYLITAWLGEGGIGRVYTAYDPELDRKIALKLVRDPEAFASAEAFARLTREAQLTARLSHPNVVAVHDVGSFGSQVFVAMELVEGETMRGWLGAGRTWRDALAMFRQAGEGLAAAHAAGLIHRDIKPDNVLVGRDGRARVTDFGLARLAATPAPDGGPAPDVVADDRLTRDGAVLGTPAYMAPEQLRGGSVDARSDQFSFCVALYEGVCGERPFGGTTIAERARAIDDGAIAIPARDPIPSWLRKVIVRGLAADPAKRHASMSALLAELADDPRARRRNAMIAAAAAVAVAAGAVAWWQHDAVAPPCAASSTHVASVWNGERRNAIELAFRSTTRPFVDQAIASVEAALDHYATRWQAMQTDACEATYVRHEQSADLLDRRDACLEERRSALGAQIALFARADGSLVDRSVRLANELPSVDACADTTALLAVVPLPRDLGRRVQIQPLRGQIGAASVLQRNARYDQARAAIADLRGPIDALAYAPVTASLDELTGSVAEDMHDVKPAIAAYDRAAIEAEMGGDDFTKARALIGAARVRGLANQEPALVTRLFAEAKAALARLGGDSELEMRMELALGAIALVDGAFADVVPHERAAVGIAERTYGADDIRTAGARSELAMALERIGKYDDASTAIVAAIAVLERQLGPGHPRTALARASWGQVLFDQAKYDEALVQQQRALADLKRVFGEHDPSLWSALSDIARTYEAKVQFRDALEVYERAKDLVDRAYGTNHPNAVLVRLNVASALLELGRFDESVAAFRAVIALAATVVGPDNIFAANAQNGIAQAWRVSHPNDALIAAEEALRLFRKLEGEAHPDVGRGYDSLGKVLDQLGRRAEAIAAVEKALALREKALGIDHPDAADSRFTLATLIIDRDHARALALAAASQHAFVASGDQDSAKQISAWIAKHGR